MKDAGACKKKKNHTKMVKEDIFAKSLCRFCLIGEGNVVIVCRPEVDLRSCDD